MLLQAVAMLAISCQSTPPPELTKLQSTLEGLQEQAVTHFDSGEYDQALAALEKIEVLAKGTDDLLHLANAYNNMGAVHFEIKSYDKALLYLNMALELNRKPAADFRRSQAAVAENLLNLGAIYVEMGNQTKAETHLDQAGELLKQLGDESGLVLVDRNRAKILESVSEFGRAIELYSRALERGREIGDSRLVAGILADMGGIREKMGDYAKAVDLLANALEIDKENEQFIGVAKDLHALGRVHEKMGSLDKSMEYHVRALNVYRIRINYKPWVTAQIKTILSLAAKLKDKQAGDYYSRMLLELEGPPKPPGGEAPREESEGPPAGR